MPVRIGIAGIAGRMGRLLAEEALAAGATLAGGTRRGTGEAPAPILPDIAALFAASDVVIDFTHASAATAHAEAAAAAGKPCVLGTSGLSATEEAAVAAAARLIRHRLRRQFRPGREPVPGDRRAHGRCPAGRAI